MSEDACDTSDPKGFEVGGSSIVRMFEVQFWRSLV